MGKRNKDFKEVNTLNTYKLMLVSPICKKLKSNELELSKSSSRQIKAFVTQEWEALKDRARKKQAKIELSKKQERRITNWFVRNLKKLKKKKRKEKRVKSKAWLFYFCGSCGIF